MTYTKVLYQKGFYACPCGLVDGCSTVSEMHNCPNMEVSNSDNPAKVVVIFQSKINFDDESDKHSTQ